MKNKQRELMLDILPVLVSEDDTIESTDDVDMDIVIETVSYSTEFIDLLSTYDGVSHDDIDIDEVISEFINMYVEYELTSTQSDELHEYLVSKLSDVLC